MRYEITGPINDFQDCERELRKIMEVLSGAQDRITLKTWSVQPPKPREGDIVKADGTAWNPGSGAGSYQYRGGAWRFLG